jgi:hypothetical protein
MKIKKGSWVLLALLFIISIPLFMWIVWLCSPKTKMVAAIIDKTVLSKDGQEHISFTWMLNNKKLTKTATKSYDLTSDYLGFFPLENEKFNLKGLERFTPQQINQLSDDADMVYFTDTYGIYYNEWYGHKNQSERSGMLYGGLSIKDLDLLTQMKAKHKLIIAEFNCIGSPTSLGNRLKFEKLFGMQWTGWVGRYFESFDTTQNKELPHWLINNYKRENGNKWPFSKSGIAFLSNNDRVVILEDSTHLDNPLPQIYSNESGLKEFSMPEKIKYSFWFDIINPNKSINQPVASFKILANAEGEKILKSNGIPNTFPAVLMHKNSDYRFYYFSGDFCDNPISMTTSYFKGIGFFKSLFYDESKPIERASFFWKFYKPMMSNILDEEKAFIIKKK